MVSSPNLFASIITLFPIFQDHDSSEKDGDHLVSYFGHTAATPPVHLSLSNILMLWLSHWVSPLTSLTHSISDVTWWIMNADSAEKKAIVTVRVDDSYLILTWF